jgi:hypothetical protein
MAISIHELNFVLFYVAIMTSVTSPDSTRPTHAAPDFAFLTNHGKTLLLISNDRRIRIRDIADRLNITERATQRIVANLASAGYIDREREGRRTLYSVRDHLPLGLPIQRDVEIAALLAILPATGGAA